LCIFGGTIRAKALSNGSGFGRDVVALPLQHYRRRHRCVESLRWFRDRVRVEPRGPLVCVYDYDLLR
jgi:hypothetical protein